MATKACINDIWAALKASEASKLLRSNRDLKPANEIGRQCLSSSQVVLPNKCADGDSIDQANDSEVEIKSKPNLYASAAEMADSDDNVCKEMTKLLDRELGRLTDPIICVRKEALDRLQRMLLGSCESRGQDEKHIHSLPKHLLRRVVKDDFVKALLRRFSDSSEKCRQASISIVMGLLEQIPSFLTSLIPYMLPVMSERMPLKIIHPSSDSLSEAHFGSVLVEPSEEVRVLLIQLIKALLEQASMFIHPFASDIASILIAAARDTSSDVLVETCTALERFCAIMEVKLKSVAREIISVLLPSLCHKHYRVRVAAIRAIKRLVLCGAHESIYDLTAFQDPNLIPIRAFYHPDTKTQYLAMLASDQNAAVRKELFQTAASWLLELSEKKQHEVRLLPYVLSALIDTNPELQTLGFNLMEEIGLQYVYDPMYEKENEAEVKDVKQYLPENIEDIVQVPQQNMLLPLQRRPCLGSRIMVKSCIGILLHAINADLQAWTSEPKQLAAKFLHVILVYAEDNATMHLQPLIVMMIQACNDPLIESRVLNSAMLLGFFIDPSAYLQILLPRISGEVGDSSVHAGNTLKVLASLLHGSPPTKFADHVPNICSILTEQHLITSIQQNVNEGVILIATELIRAWETNSQETIPLLWLLLNAMAATSFSGRSTKDAESAMEALAKACNQESSDALIATNMGMLISILPAPQYWGIRSLEVIIYGRLLQSAWFANEDILARLFQVLEHLGSEIIDNEIKLRILEFLYKMFDGVHDLNLSSRTQGFVKDFLLSCMKCGEPLLEPSSLMMESLSSRWRSELELVHM